MAVPRCALSDLAAASFEGQRPVAVERSPAVTNEYNEGPLEGQTWPEKKTPEYRGAIYTPESKNGSAGADGRRRRRDLPAAGVRALVALTALTFKLSAPLLFFPATQRRLAGTYPFSNITSQADVLAQERANLRLNLRRYLGPSPAAYYAKRTVVERLGEVYYRSPAPRARP